MTDLALTSRMVLLGWDFDHRSQEQSHGLHVRQR
jgi:hypothetical protein